jgi:hypothetical protein
MPLAPDDLVVIPLPLESGGVTFATARLISVEDEPYAEAIYPIPGTRFAPPKRIALSRYGLARIRAGNHERPDLYLYEGMVLPSPETFLN